MGGLVLVGMSVEGVERLVCKVWREVGYVE